MRARKSVLIVGMEALRVRAADREQAEAQFAAERHQRGGADFDRAGAEQEVALAVANLSAARPRRFEQRFEHLQLGRGRIDHAQVAAVDQRRSRSARAGASSSNHSDAPKSSRSDVSIESSQHGGVPGAHQAAGEAVNLGGEHVVAARDFDQFAQPRFQPSFFSRSASTWRSTSDTVAVPRLCGSLSLVSSVAWRSKKSGLLCR